MCHHQLPMALKVMVSLQISTGANKKLHLFTEEREASPLSGQRRQHVAFWHTGWQGYLLSPDLQAALDISWCLAHTQVSVVPVNECCLRDYGAAKRIITS